MNEPGGDDVEDLRPGMHATDSKTITEAGNVPFAGVSGDNDAVHTNEDFARGARSCNRLKGPVP